MLHAYHYTWGRNFLSIIDDGVICCSGDKDESYLPKAARTPASQRAVWFTLSEEYEPTATPMWHDRTGSRGLTVAETVERCGIFRIAVDAAEIPDCWEAWKRRSRVPNAVAQRLEHAALRKGSPIHLWRVSYVPVPGEKWLSVESFDGSKWVPFDWRAWRAA